MESGKLWEQLVMQRVIEAIKVNLPKVEELEEEEGKFLEQLCPESKKAYEELRMAQVQSVIDEQNLIYEQGFLDGLYLGHVAFVYK